MTTRQNLLQSFVSGFTINIRLLCGAAGFREFRDVRTGSESLVAGAPIDDAADRIVCIQCADRFRQPVSCRQCQGIALGRIVERDDGNITGTFDEDWIVVHWSFSTRAGVPSIQVLTLSTDCP